VIESSAQVLQHPRDKLLPREGAESAPSRVPSQGGAGALRSACALTDEGTNSKSASLWPVKATRLMALQCTVTVPSVAAAVERYVYVDAEAWATEVANARPYGCYHILYVGAEQN
jgi:hypothetical protein